MNDKDPCNQINAKNNITQYLKRVALHMLNNISQIP